MNLYLTKESEPDSERIIGSRFGNGCKIEFSRWGTDHVLLRSLQERAALLNAKVFRLSPLQTADEIYHHMRRDADYRRSIIFAVLNGRDIAFCIQELIKVRLFDRSEVPLVWTHLRAVDPKYQVKGIGTALLKKGYREYYEEHPQFFGGRTQAEPVVQSLYSSELFSEIPPIDRQFRGIEQQVVGHLAEGGQVMYPHRVDRRTGLIKGAYSEGETGGYTLNLDHPGIQMIKKRFDIIGVDKKKGDAILYLAIPKYASEVSSIGSNRTT